MPSDWTGCGRCGYPANGRRSRGGSGWIIILILIFGVFIFRDKLISFVPQSIKDQLAGIFSGDRVNQDAPDPIYQDPTGVKPDTNGSTGDETANGGPSETPTDLQGGSVSGYSANEEKIRGLIHDALISADDSVKLPVLNTGDDSEVIFGIIGQVVLDDPEIMFYEGCTYRTDGLLTLNYEKSREFILKAVQDADQKAGDIISRIIKPGMSDFEKELAIHDYIVSSCRYDVENFKKDTVPPEGHEAYGPLITGKAVCEGYAKAMKFLLDRAGIECFVVTGTSKGALHAWNIVNISGRYYHVDATWDDPVMENGDQILQHTYFNLTDSNISVDHNWKTADYPSCESTSSNYFYYNKLVVSSSDDFTALLGSTVESGADSLSVRFIDGSANSIDIPKLLEKAALQLNLKSISYSVNDDYGVVDIWF